MNIILDVIVAAIFIISVVFIAKKGFVKSLIGVVGFVAAIILSFTLAPPLAEASYSLFIEDAVYNTVNESVTDFSNESEAAVSSAVESIYSSLPSFVSDYAKKAGYSTEEIVSTINIDNTSAEDLATSLRDNVIKPAIISILNYVFVLLLFAPLMFISKFLAKFIKALIRGNILGGLDRLLGTVLGVCTGASIVIIFCLIVSLVSNLSNSEFLSQSIDASLIFKTILGYIPFTI